MPEPSDARLVGIVLLAIVPFLVIDAVTGLRAGFNSAFWALPLDDKLDRIIDRRRAWKRIGLVWIPITVILAAGLAGFSNLLDRAGQGPLATGALAAFLIVALLFVAIAVAMVATVDTAAEERQTTGSTPSWLRPIWTATSWAEGSFVMISGVAYVAWGVAIVLSGFPSAWAGWVSIVLGGAAAVWVVVSDYWFQHMAVVVPLVLAVALLVA